MAQNITANDNNIAYGVKKIIVDTKKDLEALPYRAEPGSTAIVEDTMDLYLLNNHNTWVKIKNLKSNGGSGGGDNPGGGGGDENNLYIWDGGDI